MTAFGALWIGPSLGFQARLTSFSKPRASLLWMSGKSQGGDQGNTFKTQIDGTTDKSVVSSIPTSDGDMWIDEEADNQDRRNLIINIVAAGLLGASGVASWQFYKTVAYTPTGFVRLPRTQFLAALGDPQARQGEGAQQWGIWRVDPGPRGVYLKDYQRQLADNGGVAPAGWKFDSKDWWVEEHGESAD